MAYTPAENNNVPVTVTNKRIGEDHPKRSSFNTIDAGTIEEHYMDGTAKKFAAVRFNLWKGKDATPENLLAFSVFEADDARKLAAQILEAADSATERLTGVKPSFQ